MNEMLRRFGLCALALATAPVLAADWAMDAAGSRLEFIATFERAAVPGVFKEFDTRLRFDPDKPAGGSLDVTVKVTSVDMNIADVNKEIRGKDWFDYGAFPQAEFHSTDLRRAEGNRYVARGTLSLKGVKQPLEVPFSWVGSGDGAIDGRRAHGQARRLRHRHGRVGRQRRDRRGREAEVPRQAAQG